MAVSRRLRFEILRRDNHACRYCGAHAPEAVLTVDHVIPVALGGRDEPSNLVTACRDCNAGKSATSPDAPVVEDVRADDLRWGAAMQRAAAIQVSSREETGRWVEAVNEAWVGWQWAEGEIPRPANWASSIAQFRAAGLTLDEIEYAVREAMGADGVYVKNIWRYFCGICWKLLDQRQQIARDILAAEDTGDGA